MNISFFVFCIGLIFGSFANVLIYRIPRHLDYVYGRSFCPSCYHQLNMVDMIPLLGWIVNRGKCKYCSCDISIQYPIVELIGGCLFLLFYMRDGWGILFVFESLLCMILLIISCIDYRLMIIPDELVIMFFMVSLGTIFYEKIFFLERILGVFCLSLPLYLMNILYKESFGGGDMKLLAVCGFYLGWKKLLVGMCLAVFAASLFCLLFIFCKKADKQTFIPFAPFISIGMFIVMLYGDFLLNWYLNIFL